MGFWHVWNVYEVVTGNHYKWDWPKSQFCMPDDSATVVWLRNIKVGNVYLFNFLRKSRNSAEFCGIPQNGFCSTGLFCGTTKRNNILQKSAELSKSVLRNSAGVLGSTELFCGTLYYKSILRNAAEPITDVLQNSVELCRLITVPQNCSAEQYITNQFCRSLRN